MENTLRINGVKRIEVNDDGDCITIPVGDDSFLRGFYEALDDIQKAAASVKIDGDDILVAMDTVIDFDRQTSEKVDGLFGEGTCRKVFGDGVLPGLEMILEFFAAVVPYLEEYRKDRAAALGKYSAARRGSSV